MALFGSATPLSKIIGQGFPVFSASFARMAIAAVGMVGFTATMLFGMRLTTGVIGSTIMSAAPAVTAIAAVVFLGAAMNWRKAGALSLAVLGCLVINVFRGSDAGDGNATLLGAALVVIAVCFEAAYTLLSRQLSDGITSIEATLGASMMALPLFVILSFVFDPQPLDFSGATRGEWIALVFWGAATGGLAPVLWYRGVRQAPAAMTAAAMSVMPLTSLTLSYVLLGEHFQWVHVLGFGLVFAGLLLMILEHASHDDSQGEQASQ